MGKRQAFVLEGVTDAHSPDTVTVSVSWSINEEDSSCWRTPLAVQIKGEGSERWETLIDLTREEGRLLRDCLTSFLGAPDLRED